MLEMVEFSTSISNRINGRKGGKVRAVHIAPEALELAYRLRYQGFSMREIIKHLKEKGYRNSKGNPINNTHLTNKLKENWETLSQILGDDKPKNSFELFIEQKVVRSRSKKLMIKRAHLIQKYHEFCNANGLLEITSQHIAKITKREQWQWKQINPENHYYYYLGISLKK